MRAWAQLIRALNVAMAVGAMSVGFLATPGPHPWLLLGPSLTALALLVAAANVHNDAVDVELDRVNAPGRPLVTGAVSLRAAQVAATVLYGSALLVGATLGKTRLLYLALMMA